MLAETDRFVHNRHNLKLSPMDGGSLFQMGVVARFLNVILGLSVWVVAFSAMARADGISINAFTSLAPDLPYRGFFQVELDCSNDGSRGKIFAGITVKSRNGLVRVSATSRDPVPVGDHVTVTVTSQIPQTNWGHETEIVRTYMKMSGTSTPFANHDFAYRHVWDTGTAKISKYPFNKDWRNARTYYDAFLGNFQEEEFAANDALLDRLNETKEVDLHGSMQLRWFISSMQRELFENRAETLGIIKNWRTFSAKSTGGAIAETMYLQDRAWRVYGGRNNPTPDPVGVKIFHERLNMARRVLLASKGYAAKNPLWYLVYVSLSNDAGVYDKYLDTYFREGIHEFPRFRELYVEMAKHWVPAHGDAKWEKVREIVDLALSNTAPTDGKGAYAIIYVAIADASKTEFDLFRDSPATWPRMKESLEDLISRYPDDDKFKNQYASFACQAHDAEVFANAWYRLGDDFDPENWYPNYGPDLCKRRFLKHT
jgi:hypothetical protein